MRLSHTSSIDQGWISGLSRWASLLVALFLAADLADAQTTTPFADTNRDDVVMRTLVQPSRAPTNEVAPPEDRAEPINPPEPNDAGPGMMPPQPGDSTADGSPPSMAAPGDNSPETPRAPVGATVKQPSSPAPATASNVITTNPPAPAKPEEKTRTPVASDPRPTTQVVADFSAFKIISERNIFDPNRSPRRAGGTPRRAKTVESVTLVGIMSYGKGDFAFFNGTSSDYKKVLKPSDTIAGYKLASISANSVKLASGEKQVELKIGSQLRREDEGEWTLSTQSEPAAASSPATSASAMKSVETGAADDGAESEVLKRLRQRREQE